MRILQKLVRDYRCEQFQGVVNAVRPSVFFEVL